MKIPNFRTRKGSELYTMTAGHRIAPLVADALGERVVAASRTNGADQRLLDVACGPGTLSLRLARELPDMRIIGVDASGEMVAQAQRRAVEAGLGNRATFATMDVHHLAFETGSLDAVTCNLGFPFFAHPVEALAEIRRVMSPGASFWSSVPDRQSWGELFEVVHEVVPVSDRLLRGFMVKMEQAALLLPTLQQAGFTVTHQECVRLPFFFADGHEAVTFFNSLFSLFTTLPAAVEGRLSRILDERFPHGITTAYVALLACARREAGTP
ncbi:MAG TPA: class I SAM-dependent methyltransferase [Ktedonobacterales bacterium]|nr:class I SAM-dependent methyltransferase [Ktedonobacterales bacterium]